MYCVSNSDEGLVFIGYHSKAPWLRIVVMDKSQTYLAIFHLTNTTACTCLVSFFCRFRVTVMAIVVVAAAALLPAVHSNPGKQLLSARKHEKYYMHEYNRLLMHFAYI